MSLLQDALLTMAVHSLYSMTKLSETGTRSTKSSMKSLAKASAYVDSIIFTFCPIGSVYIGS